MMPIQLLIEHRSAILEQAKRYGINKLYATRALSSTRGQCFLFEMEAGTTEEQLKSFNQWIKTTTGFNEEIILFNRQTFIGLIDWQSDEQQPAFKNVLNSAIPLEELDERPLEQQLEEQAHKFIETARNTPNSQQLASSMPFIQAGASSYPHQDKKQKIESIKQLELKVLAAMPGHEDDVMAEWAAKNIDAKAFLFHAGKKEDKNSINEFPERQSTIKI